MRRECGRRFSLRLLAESLKHDVQHGDQEDTDRARRQHADEDRRADATAGDFRGALGPYQRRQSDNESDGRHHHGAKAQLCAELRCLPNARAALPLVLSDSLVCRRQLRSYRGRPGSRPRLQGDQPERRIIVDHDLQEQLVQRGVRIVCAAACMWSFLPQAAWGSQGRWLTSSSRG